jgi:ferrous iron transport protein B
MKVLLVGNPNVGKSVIFTRLTGVHANSANYPGTTVSFLKGSMKIRDDVAEVIDVPGAYTLDPTNEAEAVARRFIDENSGEGAEDVIAINVVDATNLERNLYLTLQLLERNIPVVIALNMWDDTKHLGIKIELDKLAKFLGVPIVPTVALTGQGIKGLIETLPKAVSPQLPPRDRNQRWSFIGEIVLRSQQLGHRHHRWYEKLADASVKPLSGIAIAAVTLAVSFFVIRFIGEGIINYIMDPIFNNLWAPVVQNLSQFFGGSGFWHDLFIGDISSGAINFTESFGLLTSGFYVPLAMVLPYIISFYLILGLLEDIGYLPRLAVLLDSLMHRVGLHGFAIIPNLLGLGCNVPAIMATRALESKRERFIAITLISIAVPCAALQAMIFGLVGEHGIQYVLMVYGTLAIVWVILGIILNKTTKGFSPELLIEVPPYRLPPFRSLLRKLWFRMKGFVKEAVPIILYAILAINLLNMIGIFEAIADLTAPIVSGVLGLPKEAITALVIGFLRKDAALGLLAPLALTAGQLVVASVVLAMLFPCVAAFVVMLRELGLKDLMKAMAIMLAAALIVGGTLNLIL